jgi:hypothetical protein
LVKPGVERAGGSGVPVTLGTGVVRAGAERESRTA